MYSHTALCVYYKLLVVAFSSAAVTRAMNLHWVPVTVLSVQEA